MRLERLNAQLTLIGFANNLETTQHPPLNQNVENSMKGRRLPDLDEVKRPDNLQAGDYWKLLDHDSDKPIIIEGVEGKLTPHDWMVAVPMSYGFALGWLRQHTVREHEDGTISVRPGDGSSNSILVTGHRGETWHGYIEHGEFSPA